MISEMTKGDIDNILENVFPFYYAESIYNNLTPDIDNARLVVTSYLRDKALVYKDNGKVVALAVAFLGRTYYKELELDISMFYINPSYRGTGISRMLRDAIMEKGKDAQVTYTSCLSGINQENEQLFLNLWAKIGFKRLGTVMIRI